MGSYGKLKQRSGGHEVGGKYTFGKIGISRKARGENRDIQKIERGKSGYPENPLPRIPVLGVEYSLPLHDCMSHPSDDVSIKKADKRDRRIDRSLSG